MENVFDYQTTFENGVKLKSIMEYWYFTKRGTVLNSVGLHSLD